MTWLNVLFVNAHGHMINRHVVHRSLRDVVVDDLVARGCSLATKEHIYWGRENEEVVETLSIDHPGMICMTRPIQKFDFLGTPFEIPCEDVSTFLRMAKEIPARLPGPWYKFHGFALALCMNEAQRAVFEMTLDHLRPEAEARTEEFYRTRLTPMQALHEAQGLPQNVDLGPDKLAHLMAPAKVKA